jgi:alpha-tubulin suppressor-like RCC1 family protein
MRISKTLLVLALAAPLALGCGGEDPPATPGAPGAPAIPGAPAVPGAPAAPAAPAVVAQVCIGGEHTCVMRATGEVFCAGKNLDGELGDGTAQTRWSWVPVQGVTGARSIACGDDHTCAITATGVSCWGANATGALGAGHQNVTHTAVQVQGLTDAVQLALGYHFSCARRTSGAVSCWGDGENGRLGNGTNTLSATPVAVSGLADAAEISAGRAHACARKADGTVVCWGNGQSGQLGQGGERGSDSNVPVPVAGVVGATTVDAGGNHSCAITPAATLCWGQNDYGQSGAGESRINSATAVAGLTGATQLAISGSRSCVLVAGGAVQCWGYNNYTAQLLGVGVEVEKVLTPTPVTGLTGVVRFDTYSSGTSAAACALNAANQLWCWGNAGNGRFGNNEPNSLHTAAVVVPDVNALTAAPSVPATFPPVAEGLPARTSFEVGSHTVCGVREGRVYCFGVGSEGRLGLGSTRANPAGSAQPVPGIEDAVDVSTGLTRTCALRRGGTVACWGGLTGRIDSSLPLPIEGLTDVRAINVGGSAYSMTLCAVHNDGGVSCTGSQLYGQGEATLTPVRIEGITGATDVLVGTDAACALTGEGKVMCWGSGSYGQLGNGAMNGSATPVEVAGIRDAVAIGGGSYNFCALRRNGSLSCWGGNDDGQLGVGTSGRETNTGTPAAVRGLRGVASAGKAGDTMCVALRNGDGMCWGANDFGQTGHNEAETDDVTAPWDYLRTDPAVAAMGNLVEMGCGWNFCCGLHAQGGISCAGSTPLGGDSGFMGLSNVRSSTPVAAPSITFPVIAPAAE